MENNKFDYFVMFECDYIIDDGPLQNHFPCSVYSFKQWVTRERISYDDIVLPKFGASLNQIVIVYLYWLH